MHDPRFSDASDDELLLLYKQRGEVAVLGSLYQRYMPLVYGVCLKYLKDREEAKDSVMQLFEKLLETVKSHDIRNFKSWLYATARNSCLMQLRAAKGRFHEDISAFVMESGETLHLEDEPETETNIVKLEKCIDELGSEQKWCVTLFYLKQKCYKEIAEVTGYEDSKVKSYIQNGKRNLKLCMERNA